MAYSLTRLYADVVQIQHADIDSFGSGRLIGRNLVITARHVIGDVQSGSTTIDKGWLVRLWGERENASHWKWLEVKVAWQGSGDLDLALLKILPKASEPDRVPRYQTRIGLINTTRAHKVAGHGFPRGAKLNGRRTLFCPRGELNDEANSTLGFGIDQSYEPESPREDWRGFSGAAIFLEEGSDPDELWLFGVAQHVNASFSKRLAVARLSEAWTNDSFRAILADAGVSNEPPADPVPAEPWPQRVVGQTMRRFGWSDRVSKGMARARTQLRARVFKEFVDAQRRLLGGEFLEIPFIRRLDLESAPLSTDDITDSSRTVPTVTTRLSNLFSELTDNSARQVLITGEPGAGKSMMLFECARRSFIVNAGEAIAIDESDCDLALPVIVQLSQWTIESVKNSDKKKDPTAWFREWLIDQVVDTYKVEYSYVARWLEDGDLELYLDGLDEAPQKARATCAACLSAFQNGYTGRVFLACRRAEFEEVASNIKPDIAVEVRPLTDPQVIGFVDKNELTVLRKVIGTDDALFQLSHSPLMLSVMAFVYQTDEGSKGPIVVPTVNGLFAAYVDRAFKRRAGLSSNYQKASKENSIRAVQLMARSYEFTRSTVFFTSDISSRWFTWRWQKWTAIALSILTVLLAVCAIGFATFDPNNGSWLALIWRSIWALVFGSFLLYSAIEMVPLYERVKWNVKRGVAGAGIGISIAMGLALWQIVASSVAVGCTIAAVVILVSGLLWWALGVLVIGLIALWIWVDVDPIKVIQWVIGFFLIPCLPLSVVGWITTKDFSPGALLAFVGAAAGGDATDSLGWLFVEVIGLSIWTCFRFTALLLGLVAFLIGSTTLVAPEHLKQMKGSILRMFLIAVLLGVMSSTVSVLLLWLLEAIAGRTIDSVWQLRYVALAVGTLIFGFCGGVRSIAYFIVRVLLVLGRTLPMHYADLLEFAVDVGILVRAGNGYSFIHKLEMEYFSQLPEMPES